MTDLTDEEQKELLEQVIDEEVEKLKKKDENYKFMSNDMLRRIARHNIVLEYETLVRQLAKKSRDSERVTVGSLFGKTRKQILKEQEEW